MVWHSTYLISFGLCSFLHLLFCFVSFPLLIRSRPSPARLLVVAGACVAEDSIKTSLFKWKPDWELGADFFDKAG